MPKTVLLLVAVASPAVALKGQTCGAWSVAAPPDPAASNKLADLAGDSPDNLWSLDGDSNIAQHDGLSWRPVPQPDASIYGLGFDLYAVAAAPGGGSVWAGGSVASTYPTWNEPLVARRQGGVHGSWDSIEAVRLRPQTVYPYAPRGGTIDDMLVLGENDVWAVGQAAGFGDARATTVAMALRFDGSDWTDEPTPQPGNRSNRFSAVAASGSDDAWAVGYYRNVAGVYRALTIHWDGDAWTHVPNPAEAISQTFLKAVAVIGPDDVWVAGHINYAEPLFMHWDGSSWTIASSPPAPGGAQREIAALAAVSSEDIWAADSLAGELYHYDGADWSIAASPAPAPGSSHALRAMAVLGPCNVVAAGAELVGGGSRQLLERLGSCYADCDGSGGLDFFDFLCFQNQFAAGDLEADCDGSGSLDFFDFLCFQNEFAAGCP